MFYIIYNTFYSLLNIFFLLKRKDLKAQINHNKFMEKKICLTIAGSDSGGGAGIQQDLKTFAALDVHGVSAITALTAQNTCEVREVFQITSDFIKSQIDVIFDDFNISAAKTGMLYSSSIISAVSGYAKKVPFIVDPVMVSTSGDILLEEEALSILKEKLLSRAALITPNIREAEILTGIKIKNFGDMKKASEELSVYAPVLLKGGHLSATDILFYDNRVYKLKGRYIEGKFHGTGCAYSAAVTAYIARDYNLVDAVKMSKTYIQILIENSCYSGKGAEILDPLYNLRREAEKIGVIEELSKNVEKLLEIKNIDMLIPEVGMNFGYALKNPETTGDIAALNGRIVKVRGKARTSGCVEFGASKHIAGVILAASKFYSEIRACLNIKFSRDVLQACFNSGLSYASFDRRDEPHGKSTMEWGTAGALKKAVKAVDIIYDRGGTGKEAMIRVLGTTPSEIIEKVAGIVAE